MDQRAVVVREAPSFQLLAQGVMIPHPRKETGMATDSMITCLWFDHGEARNAAKFYASVFRDSHVGGCPCADPAMMSFS